jgi:GNAT superfamily N-acetyltransferase
MIHHFLTSSYWANGIPVEVLRRSVESSFPFGVYKDNKQVGFARVITDHATFAYLADVFILEDHRGRGLGKWLMEVITEHPELQGLRRWMLATQDAHGLYRKFGFRQLGDGAIYMEKYMRSAYKNENRDDEPGMCGRTAPDRKVGDQSGGDGPGSSEGLERYGPLPDDGEARAV